MPPPTPQSPNFLDATVRLQYLHSIRLVATCPTAELLHIRNDLLRLLLHTPLNDDATCNQAMYAATLLTTVGDLLGGHHPPPSIEYQAIHRSPIEWTAVRILLAPHGEQRLPLVMRVYDHMQLEAPQRSDLLERVVSAVGQQQLQQQTGLGLTDAQQLLDLIRSMGSLGAMRAAVENVVRLKRVRLPLVLEILLIPDTDLGRHPASCLVYQRFVQVLAEPPVFGEFALQLVPLLDTADGVAVFHLCVRLRRFYDVLVAKLRENLESVRVVVSCGDGREMFCVAANEADEADTVRPTDWRLRVHDARRIVCGLLHRGSPVRRKFGQHLGEMRLADAVREFVTQLLYYD